MHVGILIPGDPRFANETAVAVLTDCGVRSVYIECREDTQDIHGLALAEFSRQCRESSLKVFAVPRGYGLVLRAQPGARSPYLRRRRDVLQVDSRGRRVPRACPNNPEFVAWFGARMADLAEMLACDGFVWDDPAFHFSRGAWGCRCLECQRLYEWEHEERLPTELTHSVVRFRRRAIVMLLLAVASSVKRANPICQCIVMSAGQVDHEQLHTGVEQWTELLDCSGVQSLAVLADWRRRGASLEDTLSHLGRPLMREAELRGKGAQLWVIGSPRREHRLLDAIRFAARLGAPELVISDYASLMGSDDFTAFRDRLRAAVIEVGDNG